MTDGFFISDPWPDWQRDLDVVEEDEARAFYEDAESYVDEFDFVPDDDDYEPTDHDRELLLDAAHAYCESTAPHERSAGGLRDALADEWWQVRRVRDEERRQAVCPRRPMAVRPLRQRRPCGRARGRRTRRSRHAAARSPGGGDSDSDGPGEAWRAHDVDLPELCGHEGRARARVARHTTATRPPTASESGRAAPREPQGGFVNTSVGKAGYAVVVIPGQSSALEGWVTVEPSGVLHIERAKLRVSDVTQAGGIRRQPTASRTFSRSVPYDIRWLRSATAADANGVGR